MPKPFNPNRMSTQLRIDKSALDKLQVIADTETRSRNMMICYILEQYIQQYEKKHGKIEISE